MNSVAKSRKRVDELGRAFAGSQLQVQLYVNRRRPELNQAISNAVKLERNVVIDWRSPIEPSFSEYMDAPFLRALELSHLQQKLERFWPSSGPRWDGLAVLRPSAGSPEASGYLLIEGKSYPGEIYGPGCTSPAGTPNRDLINEALETTARELSPLHSTAWTGRLYQYANRLAHVLFLQKSTGRPVWLVNLCFTEDRAKPHSQKEWETALKEIKRELGFEGKPIPSTVDVFLSTRDRSEMLAKDGNGVTEGSE
ncbi:MAG: hypothetical protein JWL97_803 [Gemmatimonadales bacterium]|nr:hypothetical protein [Gemmatimonadales bacterium]